MPDLLITILTESWSVLGQMAPYLLFGFLAAGMLSELISAKWVERHLGGKGFVPILKASLFGVPLPLCSCSVIPVSVSMHRSGAGRAATTAFLLSTPQTGVDSIAVTYALLGPVFAVFRPLAALVTGLFGGELVRLFGEPDVDHSSHTAGQTECSCCCATEKPSGSRLSRILHYGFIVLPKDIGLALFVGILIAGLMAAVVPQDYLAAYMGSGVLSILLMMAAGVPVYVCATASVPIAAGLIHMGASPGAALAFLIAGPATNAATFTTIWKALGKKTASLYLFTVGVSAVCCGLLLNWVIQLVEISLPQLSTQAHEHLEGGWFYHVSAIVLLLILLLSYFSKTESK